MGSAKNEQQEYLSRTLEKSETQNALVDWSEWCHHPVLSRHALFKKSMLESWIAVGKKVDIKSFYYLLFSGRYKSMNYHLFLQRNLWHFTDYLACCDGVPPISSSLKIWHFLRIPRVSSDDYDSSFQRKFIIASIYKISKSNTYYMYYNVITTYLILLYLYISSFC